jgi:membrane protein implicated in regulation of membrane protease activity
LTRVLVVWVVVGLALIGVELHHLAFYALFVAIGAFAATGVAAVAPSAIAVQVLTMVATSALGILALRPFVSRAFAQRHENDHITPGVHGGLTGQQVLTLDVVRGTTAPGHVRLAGERWLAVSGDDRPIPAGTKVVVTAVVGTTLTVWPTHPSEEATVELDEGPPRGAPTDTASHEAPPSAEEERS